MAFSTAQLSLVQLGVIQLAHIGSDGGAGSMATIGTLSPNIFTMFDNDGLIVSGGQLFTYEDGTTTKLTTYLDDELTTPNSNPVIMDSAGRAIIFLPPGSTYTYVASPANDSDPPTNPFWTLNGVNAVPSSSVTVDITGQAGEALVAGEPAYISDGSGGLTAGKWYKTDADNTYSSTTPLVGAPPNNLAADAFGSFRMQGPIDVAGPVTPGASYFVSTTAGGITTTPTVNTRYIGQAGTSSTVLVLSPNPPPQATAQSTISYLNIETMAL